MAKPKFIIPVRSSDAWVSLSVAEGCNPFASYDRGCITDITLVVYKPACPQPDVRTCVGVDTCGNKIWKVTPAPAPTSITIVADGVDNSGRVVFRLTPEFVALGKGRLNAELKACGKTVSVMFQVFSQPLVVDYQKGAVSGCAQIGTLFAATIPDNCVVVKGWVPVNVGGVLRGYGRDAPCGTYTSAFITEDCTTVYLDPAIPCVNCVPTVI